VRDEIAVARSDLEKIEDALAQAAAFLEYRDHMNGTVHLARVVRMSPLTTVVVMAKERCQQLLGENGEPPGG
jgi:hypothetical protein